MISTNSELDPAKAFCGVYGKKEKGEMGWEWWGGGRRIGRGREVCVCVGGKKNDVVMELYLAVLCGCSCLLCEESSSNAPSRDCSHRGRAGC